MQASYEGYFPITANYDWCEANYVYCYYIAEFFNSLSSILMIILGCRGIYNSALKAPIEIPVMYFWLSIVGIGSTLFHGTLLRESQVLDELPMLYAVLSICFAIHPAPRKKKALYLAPFLTSIAIITTVCYYHFSESPYFQHIAFIIGMVYLLVRSLKMKAKAKHPAYGKVGYTVLTLQIISAIAWLLDHELCAIFQPYHLHSVWHLLAGTAAYFYMKLVEFHLAYTDKVPIKISYTLSFWPHLHYTAATHQ